MMKCCAVLLGAVALTATAEENKMNSVALTSRDVPMIIAEANQAQASDKAAVRTLGVCFPVPGSSEHFSLENVLSPKGSAGEYLRSYEHKSIAYDTPATTSVLQRPTHGILRLETEANHFGTGRFDPADPGYAYLPTDNYLGKDKAIFLVDFGNGLKVKVIYFLQAVEGTTGGNNWEQTFCSETGFQWKISSALDASSITSVGYRRSIASASD